MRVCARVDAAMRKRKARVKRAGGRVVTTKEGELGSGISGLLAVGQRYLSHHQLLDSFFESWPPLDSFLESSVAFGGLLPFVIAGPLSKRRNT